MKWSVILCVLFLLLLFKKRGDIVAVFAGLKYRKRDYPKALNLYKLADKIGPLNLSNRVLLGYVCLRCGELDLAAKHLEACRQLTKRHSPDRNQIRNLLSLISWKEGRLDDAIDELEAVMESGYKTTVVYQNLGIFYNLSGDKERALAFNLEAYDYNADDLIICDNLAEAYAGAGQYEKAAEVYAALLEKEPHFPEAYYGYGEVLLHLGKREEGLSMIEESLTKPFSYLSIRPKEEIEALYQRRLSE